ncbi:hypothetical protein NQZ68_017794, partial [Dissostichus eleginoides]
GRASLAAGSIADCVHELQLSHPDAPAIVLGDMKQCRLETVLPGIMLGITPGKTISWTNAS